MFYKPDWNETREWLTGWWNREIHGHWALGVIAPRSKPLPAIRALLCPRTTVRSGWMRREIWSA